MNKQTLAQSAQPTLLKSPATNSPLRRQSVSKPAEPTQLDRTCDLIKVPVRNANAVRLMPKLRIDPVDSPLEREADRVADAVMRSPEPSSPLITNRSALIQRKCASCAKEDDDADKQIVQRSPAHFLTRERLAIQRKCSSCEQEGDEDKDDKHISRSPGVGSPTSHAPTLVSHVLSQPGQPLPLATRSFFESRMGTDFSSVRIHDNSLAAESAASINARAYTVGNSIAFASGEYAPNSISGQRLLAHELTHVVQQAGSTPIISRSPEDQGETAVDDEKPGLFGRTFSKVVDFAVDTTKDAMIWVVRKISPELADIIDQGPTEFISQLVHKTIGSWLASLPGVGNLLETVGAVSNTIEAAAGLLVAGLKGDSAGACDSFASLLSSITQLVQALSANPAIGLLKDSVGFVTSTVQKVVGFVAAEAFELLAPILGGAWTLISGAASRIWGWIVQVKDAAADAAIWIGEKLGLIGEGSEEGVLGWIKRKAGEAWNAIRIMLAPVLGPLQIVAKTLVLFSPIGPFYAIIKYGPRLVEAVQWFWANRNDPDLISKSREYLKDTIFPQMIDAAIGFKNLVGSAVAWMANSLAELQLGLVQLKGALGAVPILGSIVGFVDLMLDGVTALANFGKTKLQEFGTWVGQAAHTIVGFIQPVKEVLVNLSLAVASLPMLPLVLMGRAWNYSPQCIKLPIINFVLDILITGLSTLGDLRLLGPLWPLLQPGILAFLTEVRNSSVETKIAVSQNIAALIGGKNVDFLMGFAKGLLSGIWDSLLDPIKSVWMVIEGLSWLLKYFEGLAARALSTNDDSPKKQERTSPALPPVTSASASTSMEPMPAEIGNTAESGTAPTHEIGPELARLVSDLSPDLQAALSNLGLELEAGFKGGDVTYESLSTKLGELWSSIQQLIAGLGSQLARYLMTSLSSGAKANSELGEKLGAFVGMFALDAILAVLTGGLAAEAKVVATVIQKFINWPMDMLGHAFKYLAKVGQFIWDGLKGIGRFAKTAFKDALSSIARKLTAFSERMMAKFGSRGAGAATRAAEREAAQLAERKALSAAEKHAIGEAGEDAAKLGKKAESQAAREASVAESGKMDSGDLTQDQIRNEFDDIAAHKNRVQGVSPERTAQVGEHTWREKPPGNRWCRHSDPVDIVCATTDVLREELAGDAARFSADSYFTYSELRNVIKKARLSGRSIGLEAHHLLEKRFAALVGVKKSKIISVPLTPKWHRNVGGLGFNIDQAIFNEIRALGSDVSSASVDIVWKAHRNVYIRSGNKEWAHALYDAYFKSKGVLF